MFRNIINDYINKSDWEVKENANSSYATSSLSQYLSGKIIKEYWMHEVYTDEIRKCCEEDNKIHIHDLTYLNPYCAGWSIEDILCEGFGGIENKLECKPVKHFNTALNQIVNFLFTIQSEFAGAQAISNFDTILAPFIRYDSLTRREVYKYLQSFIFSLNVPNRSGVQCIFSNISFDIICPETHKNIGIMIGGELKSETYGEFQEEMDMLNDVFAEIMIEGDGNKNMFQFPIPTYNLYKEFDFEDPRYTRIWEMTGKYGVPYFSNFRNTDLDPNDFRSMCCRLRLDISKIHKRNGGLFGSSTLTGSIGVVTLNLPNLAYRSSKKIELFKEGIRDAIRIGKDSLELKRAFLEKNMDLFPYSKRYLGSVFKRTGKYWSNHFNTIGIIGMNEAVEYILGGNIYENKQFVIDIMNFLREELLIIQQQTGHLYNLEATPAESTAYRLAQKDKVLFKDNSQGIKINNYYTNSTLLPVEFTDDLQKCLEHQQDIQSLYTGGTVFHTFIDSKINAVQAKNLVKYISEYNIPYISITPTFSICKNHGYLSGQTSTCPKCNGKCLIFSRIVGYYRPVSDWNNGKMEEFGKRKYYNIDNVVKDNCNKNDFDRNRKLQPRYIARINELKIPIAGFDKMTMIDYPNKIASILYTQGCNFKCGYCHNSSLVPVHKHQPNDNKIIIEAIEYVLNNKNKNIVLTGGEVTLHKDLIKLLEILKELGVNVKINTNGYNIKMLSEIIDKKLVDYIAMDIKGDLKNYSKIVGVNINKNIIAKSIELVKASEIDHMFITTIVPDITDIEDIMYSKCVTNSESHFTNYRYSEGVSNQNLRKEYSEYEFNKLIN